MDCSPKFEEELQKTKKILEDPEGTIPFLFLNAVDHWIHKIFRRSKASPWWFAILLVALLSQIPTLLTSVYMNEIARWQEHWIGVIWMAYILLGLSASIIARMGVKYLFENINEHVVNEMERVEDLLDLQKTLKQVWLRQGSKKYVFIFTVIFALLWSYAFSSVYAGYLKVELTEFGYGLYLGTIVFGILTAPALFMEFWFFLFILHIGGYKFRLHKFFPVYTDVVQQFSRTTTKMLYGFAIFIAFATFSVSRNPVTGDLNARAMVLVALIGWIPTTIYFFGNQSSIRRIVATGKWRTLNEIQDELNKRYAGDILDRENSEAINRLIGYHSTILSSPNSTFGLSTGLNFLNQLALPVLGLLLANFDKIRESIEKIVR